MSANQMNTQAASSTYVPVDVAQRHEYGIQKNRKTASTGGGRAWSEDEVWIKQILSIGAITNQFLLGSLSPSNSSSEDAL